MSLRILERVLFALEHTITVQLLDLIARHLLPNMSLHGIVTPVQLLHH